MQRLGAEHAEWFDRLQKRYELNEEPLVAEDGSIIAQPLLWIRDDERIFACFGREDLPTAVRDRLEDHGIGFLVLGASI